MELTRPAGRSLLIVEDDAELGPMLADLFAGSGYDPVDLATDGHRGLHLALSRPYQAMIIDRRLPALDGLDLLGRLRRQGVTVPVLMLTALGAVADRVAGLDAGAEDYLAKPFEVEELLARVRALHRRHREEAELLPLGAAAQLDTNLRAVRYGRGDGRQVALSGREFALLHLLATRPSAVYTRADLRSLVFDDAPSESIVDTYVYYLRRKLGRAVIRTIRGVGYQLGEL